MTQATGKIVELGQITREIIRSWREKFEKRGGEYYCGKCGSRITQTICYVSIHLKVFEPECAGTGQVEKINYPYCLKCDGDVDHAVACYHTDVYIKELGE